MYVDGASDDAATQFYGDSDLNEVYGAFNLPLTGNYLIQIQSQEDVANTYDFQLLAAASPDIIQVNLGDTINGSLETPVSEDQIQFNGSAGQLIDIDFADHFMGEMSLSLINPDGSLFAFGFSFDPSFPLQWGASDGPIPIPLELTQSGTHTLSIVASDGVPNNDYVLDIREFVPPGPIDFGDTVNGNAGLLPDVWTFEGEMGQKVTVEFAGIIGPTNVAILDPSGAVLEQEQFTPFSSDYGFGILTLPSAGTYSIEVQGGGFGPPSPYQFTLGAFLPGGEINLGDSTFGDITATGESHDWTFNANSGTTLYVDFALATDTLSYQLISPSGGVVESATSANTADLFRNDIVLTETGEYTLRVEGDGTSLPTYQFTVGEIPAAEIFSYVINDIATGSIEAPLGEDQYTFSSAGNEWVYLDIIDSTDLLDYELIAPDGSVVLDPERFDPSTIPPSTLSEVPIEFFYAQEYDFAPILLDQAGTYTFRMKGDFATTPSYTFQFFSMMAPTATSFNIGDTNNGDIATLDEQEHWTFNANQGDRVFINFTDVDEELTYKLVSQMALSSWMNLHRSKVGSTVALLFCRILERTRFRSLVLPTIRCSDSQRLRRRIRLKSSAYPSRISARSQLVILESSASLILLAMKTSGTSARWLANAFSLTSSHLAIRLTLN